MGIADTLQMWYIEPRLPIFMKGGHSLMLWGCFAASSTAAV